MRKSIFGMFLLCLVTLSPLAKTLEGATDEQKIAWLKDNAVRVDFDGKDFRFLDKPLEDVEIVLLGEISHGDGKTFTVKTELIKYLHKNLGFKVRRVGGLKSTFFSGEGLVVDLTGPGRVLMQTRSTDAFLAWLIPQLPKPSPSTGQ